MSSHEGTRAVIAALAANLGIAAGKLLAFVFTGSSALLAEAAHSAADSGNQILLLWGGRRARRGADVAHPFGYGRERYLSGFLVSVILFSLGGLFALYEGYHKLLHPEPLTDWYWAVGVLVFAVVLESWSFRTAFREAKPGRGAASWLRYVRRAKAPELPIVLLEDLGAVIGLVFALVGVTLSVLTGNGRWDGIATVAIGALLVVIAVVLAVEMKSLLIGEAASDAELAGITAALVADDSVERLIHIRTLHLGPDELLVAAKIAFRHDDSAARIAEAIDAAERRIRATTSYRCVIYLEPDIYRADQAARDVSPD
jgi:cation diffusion facilitator family transporter